MSEAYVPVSVPPRTESLSAEARELARWRRRMLMPMLALLSLLTLAFIVASVWQIADVQRRIGSATAGEQPFAAIDQQLASGAASIPAADLRARIALEHQALTLRYQQASAVLASRAWVRFMGFLTGMVLALIGSTFTLGRLETSAVQASGEGPGWKGSLATTSPGLVLAALGTILMVGAVVVRINVDVREVSTYLPAQVLVQDSTEATQAPAVPRSPARTTADSLRRLYEEMTKGTAGSPAKR